jgi:hypothetical protein
LCHQTGDAFRGGGRRKLQTYQPGNFPALGKSAGVDALKAETDSIAFGESKGVLSQNGDLGFLWGEY